MSTKNLFLCTIFVLIYGTNVNAQTPTTCAGYNFSASSTTYTYLTGGTSLSSWVGDDNYINVPITFTFPFCGANYTSVGIANNGFVNLGGTLSSGSYYGAASISSVQPVIMPLWADLMGSTASPYNSAAQYIVTGSAPNRVLTIEWAHWGLFSISTAGYSDVLSFQVKLYENGYIEFLYKQEANATGFSPNIGIAKTSADYAFLNNNSASPTITTTSQPTVGGRPATGQLYRFSFCSTPSILSQPQSLTKCSGDAASFLVNASNVVTYQWQENSGSGFNNIINNTTYNGANTSLLNINNLPNSFNGYSYRCVTAGTCPTTVTTNTAILTLSDAINIYSVSPSDTVCEGNPTHLDILAGGSGLVYTWQIQDKTTPSIFTDVPTSTVYSGATTSTLNIAAVPDTLQNRNFRVKIAATTSCPVVSALTSNPINLTVTLQPAVTPVSLSINAGSQARFTVAQITNPNNYTYQWQEDRRNGNGFYNLVDNTMYTGTDNDTLYINDVTPEQSRYAYRCIVYGLCDAGYILSKVAILDVKPTSIGSVDSRQNLSVYPNPVSGNEISVTINDAVSDHTTIRIVDQLGRTVASTNMNANQKKIDVGITKLAAGIYILQLSDPINNISGSIQFVKQ